MKFNILENMSPVYFTFQCLFIFFTFQCLNDIDKLFDLGQVTEPLSVSALFSE